MIKKPKKKPSKFTLEGLIFSSSVQNDTEKFVVTTTGLSDAKYSLINRKIYQAIGVIILNKINCWKKIKNNSTWANVNFQSHLDNSQTQYFAKNFVTKNAGDILDFVIKLIGNNNKDIEFGGRQKKFPIINFLIEFFA